MLFHWVLWAWFQTLMHQWGRMGNEKGCGSSLLNWTVSFQWRHKSGVSTYPVSYGALECGRQGLSHTQHRVLGSRQCLLCPAHVAVRGRSCYCSHGRCRYSTGASGTGWGKVIPTGLTLANHVAWLCEGQENLAWNTEKTMGSLAQLGAASNLFQGFLPLEN